VRSLFQGVAATGDPCSRHLVRIVPLQRTCFAGAAEIEEALVPFIREHFHKPHNRCTFMVQLKRRNNNAVSWMNDPAKPNEP
jgi:hypothetical protein